MFYQALALSSRSPPSSWPGGPPKPPFRSQSQQSRPQKSFKRRDGPASLPSEIYKFLTKDALEVLKAYITEAINKFHIRKVPNTDVVEESEADEPEPSEPASGPPDLPEPTLDT